MGRRIRFTPAKDINYEDVWGVISSIYQSNSVGLNTATFCLSVTSVRLPVGQGRVKCYNTFEEECSKRTGIIPIKNKDNLCLPRALVVAMAKVNNDPEFDRIRKDTKKMQTDRTTALIIAAKVIIPPEDGGIPEIQIFQNHLREYKIVVYTYGSRSRDIIIKGAVDSTKKLNLLHHAGHFNVIGSLTAAFACDYYCQDCYVPFFFKK